MFLLHNLRTVRSQNNRCSDVYKTFERLDCIWCDSVDLRIQLKETFQFVWHFFLFILSLSRRSWNDAQLLSGNTTTPTVKCRQQAAEIDRENKVLIWRWVLLKLSELEMWA